MAEMRLSPVLADVCGGEVMSRQEVLRNIWVYIRKHSLNSSGKGTDQPISAARSSKIILVVEILSGWKGSTGSPLNRLGQAVVACKAPHCRATFNSLVSVAFGSVLELPSASLYCLPSSLVLNLTSGHRIFNSSAPTPFTHIIELHVTVHCVFTFSRVGMIPPNCIRNLTVPGCTSEIGFDLEAVPILLLTYPPLRRFLSDVRTGRDVCSRRSNAHAARMVLRTPEGSTALSSDRASHLPWEKSVGGEEFKLLFMPFLTYQLDKMRKHLDGLEDLPFAEDLSLQLSTRKAARIESWQWKSSRFRKIRATYIDAGLGAQVFNSVWYPHESFDAPLLGIDFLSFGRKKVLCVLDFQPLTQDPEYLARYCEPIAYIKEKYEGLAGEMSARFYDETQFFSRQLAFAKFDSADPVESQLFPAFKEYLRDYMQMISGLKPDESPESMLRVRDLHKEYDVYSAERDPAVGLFSTYWGKEWANKFTHEFLFSDSEMPADDPPAEYAAAGNAEKEKK
eukprot:IDg14506t1